MTEQQTPLTFDGILEMIRETGQQMKENERKYMLMSQETDRRFRETEKKISALGSRIGEIVERGVCTLLLLESRIPIEIKGLRQNNGGLRFEPP